MRIACVAAAALVVASSAAHAQWSWDPAANLLVAGPAGSQELCKIAPAPDGGCFIAWWDNQGSYVLRVQRLDSFGVAQWGAQGVAAGSGAMRTSLVDFAINADAGGNCILTWTDIRSGPDLDVYGQLVAPDGTLLWGAAGLTLSNDADEDSDPRCVQNTDGNYVFVWPRVAGTRGLYMQIVTPSGGALLANGGEELITLSPGPSLCEMVAADDGSVILVWIHDTRQFNSPRHVITQKYGRNAVPGWNAVSPVTLSANPVPIVHRPSIRYDGSGGGVYAWHDTRESNRFNVWLQRVNAQGQPLFADGGMKASTDTAFYHLDPAIAFDSASGDLYAVWNERNTGQSQWGVYAQRVDASGARLWGESGLQVIPVNTTLKFFQRAAWRGDGPAFFCLDQPNTPIPGERVLAMALTPEGAPACGAIPHVISSTVSVKGRLPVAVNGAGMAMLAWEDSRGGDRDIYAQNYNPDCTLGQACIADFNRSGGTPDDADIAAFFDAWAAGDPGADVNHSGGTPDDADVTFFFGRWNGGC